MAATLHSIQTIRQVNFVTVITVMTFLATLAIIIRLLARFILVRKPGLDDLFMGIGWILTLTYYLQCIFGTLLGYGVRDSELQAADIVPALKLTFTIEVIYYAIITSIKVSICFLYLRYAPAEELYRRLCWGTIIFLGIFFVICETVTLAQCIPLNEFWDIPNVQEGRCINQTSYFYTTSAIHIVIDAWLIGLPIRVITKMKISKRDKIMLLVIFGMGIFALIASITRLYSIKVWTHSQDPYYDAVPVNLWSMVEVCVAIICASMPAMRPALRPEIWRKFRSRGTYDIKTDQRQLASDEFRPPPPSIRRKARSDLENPETGHSGDPLDIQLDTLYSTETGGVEEAGIASSARG